MTEWHNNPLLEENSITSDNDDEFISDLNELILFQTTIFQNDFAVRKEILQDSSFQLQLYGIESTRSNPNENQHQHYHRPHGPHGLVLDAVPSGWPLAMNLINSIASTAASKQKSALCFKYC